MRISFKLPPDCRASEIDQAIKELVKEGELTEDVAKVVRKQAVGLAMKERVERRRLLKKKLRKRSAMNAKENENANGSSSD